MTTELTMKHLSKNTVRIGIFYFWREVWQRQKRYVRMCRCPEIADELTCPVDSFHKKKK